MIELRVAGNSQTKQRQRFDPRTKRAYSPASNIINEGDVRQIWREAGEPRIEDETAIAIEVLIYVVRPKGHYNTKGDLSKKGLDNPIPRNKKPDCDNALKLVMDSLNSRAYKDDVLISDASVKRRWADWPVTVIRLYPVQL